VIFPEVPRVPVIVHIAAANSSHFDPQQ